MPPTVPRSAAEVSTAAALTDVDVAGGIVLGFERDDPLKVDPDAPSPRKAFENALAGALTRPPCVVSFSGGRDSSALLALATTVSRREGLPLPVPVTMRFPSAPDTDESDWQEATVRHLGLDDWVKLDLAGELDLVGPIATGGLSKHGLLWPFNTHFHVPIFRAATGGAVITGFGGDEVGLSSATASAEQVLAARRRPRPVDILVVGLASSPRAIRRTVHRRRERRALLDQAWLTSEGVRALSRARGDDATNIPLGWDKVLLRAIWTGRYFRICRRSFDLLGAGCDVAVHHPWVDPSVLVSLAKVGGFGGMRSRSDVVASIFGDVLPPRVVTRSTKAVFDEAMWTAEARSFAREWSGEGVPVDLVSPDCLRAEWLRPRPDARSATLIQAAWLHDHR
jgi:asparagine synthase (glutamine-hydrolysing)